MPSVAILLCTYNGAKFLPAQLKSFVDQTLADWRVYASDDGSADATLAILSEFRDQRGSTQVQIRNGPRRGFVANFLALACDRSISTDYYAFSDQDDIWEPQKLARAVALLQQLPAELPAVYCSRTRLIDGAGRSRGFSSLFRRAPEFRNALVQSIAGSNTMVFNGAARDLLMTCGPATRVASHDWLLYLLTTAVGGKVIYDPLPMVRYRVHAGNVMGANTGLLDRQRRLGMLIQGTFTQWLELNLAALETFRPRMTAENRERYDLFRDLRKRGLVGRLAGYLKTGVYRQPMLGNIGLMIAVCTGKI